MGPDRRMIVASALAAVAAPGFAHAEGGDPPTPAWPPGERIALWPKRPPGAPKRLPKPAITVNGPPDRRDLRLTGVGAPELAVFRPANPNGAALIVFPGGGYRFLSIQKEGITVAERFIVAGLTVFVLSYRLPGEGWTPRHLAPLQDAQRALRLMRANAAAFGLDPGRVGVVGFSAGGHLAADIAVAHGEETYEPVDAADGLSARPDFAGLIYPVTTLRPVDGRPSARPMLFGDQPTDDDTADSRSPALRVRAETPPIFIAHAADDPIVPPEHAVELIRACRAAKVPVEAHIFEQGGHGFGLSLNDPEPAARWPDLFQAWMRSRWAS